MHQLWRKLGNFDFLSISLKFHLRIKTGGILLFWSEADLYLIHWPSLKIHRTKPERRARVKPTHSLLKQFYYEPWTEPQLDLRLIWTYCRVFILNLDHLRLMKWKLILNSRMKAFNCWIIVIKKWITDTYGYRNISTPWIFTIILFIACGASSFKTLY